MAEFWNPTGDLDGVRALAERAHAAVSAITDADLRGRVLTAVAEAAARAGDQEWAQAAAGAVTPWPPGRQVRALTAAANAAALAGNSELAQALAEVGATINSDASPPAEIFIDIALTATTAGDVELARVMARKAEAAANAIIDPGTQAQMLSLIASLAEAELSEPAHARSLLTRGLTSGHWNEWLDVAARIAPTVVITIANEYATVTGPPGSIHSGKRHLTNGLPDP